NGQYPAGLIDWGFNVWFIASPWGQFTTNSISFNGAGPTSASFTFISGPRGVGGVDAVNGGTTASNVSLACPRQTTSSVSVAPNQLLTITTGWTGTCSSVTVGSNNDWFTNFDNLAIDTGP